MSFTTSEETLEMMVSDCYQEADRFARMFVEVVRKNKQIIFGLGMIFMSLVNSDYL